MSESTIFIEEEFEKPGKVQLVSNAAAFFFDIIPYEQCGKEMEPSRDSVRVSMMHGYLW